MQIDTGTFRALEAEVARMREQVLDLGQAVTDMGAEMRAGHAGVKAFAEAMRETGRQEGREEARFSADRSLAAQAREGQRPRRPRHLRHLRPVDGGSAR